MRNKAFLGLGILIAWVLAVGFGSAHRVVGGRLGVAPSTVDKNLDHKPVMISIIQEGKIVDQKEMAIGSFNTFTLPAGLYDVRAEGDGLLTLMKKGVTINEDKANEVRFPITAGTGARVVEFATGGLTREEIATRLNNLEANVAAIKAKIGIGAP